MKVRHVEVHWRRGWGALVLLRLPVADGGCPGRVCGGAAGQVCSDRACGRAGRRWWPAVRSAWEEEVGAAAPDGGWMPGRRPRDVIW